MTTTLSDNLARVRERISAACRAAGRAPDAVRLVAVTKGVDGERALELARAGAVDLAENRVQELESKARFLREQGAAVRWHLIGHLQRNKARRAVELADVIHSVDSLRLLDALERLAAELERTVDIYLEVALATAEGRTGFAPEALPAAAEHARSLAHLRLLGLMAMAPEPQAEPPSSADRERARAVFAELARIARALPQEAFADGRASLSMGMSSDLEEAVREGSDCVRIGSALFTGLAGVRSVA